jgi:hypothetical protein
MTEAARWQEEGPLVLSPDESESFENGVGRLDE